MTRHKHSLTWHKNHPEHSRKINKSGQLRRAYGLTLQQVEEMKTRQNNLCAICHKPGSDYKYGLHIDHNHTTGKVREMLCSGCNTFVGRIEGNPERLQQVLNYLEKHNEEVE